ncbi:NADH dehydrogenase [ubiquinone] 1 alpha subcomplex subunit 11 isoform X1 [Caloenas nicobarica]|uniref:NADH dehydrogenase [ubiquinone] 1 alpha subcomplex subunit 11 isoform X1 n=1 Tax=Caloenas nicobarica TaxID=187106 RepID=UPI0032B7E3B5
MAGYWDGPEGEQCPRRTWLTTRVGAAAGLVGTAYRIILLQPGSALAALQMAATDTVTMATLGAVFGVTTCLSAQIREKPEDPLNYFIGGCATGAVLGARDVIYFARLPCEFSVHSGTGWILLLLLLHCLSGWVGSCGYAALASVGIWIQCERSHSYMTGTTACLGFGITAALMKIGNKEGWRLMGPPKL